MLIVAPLSILGVWDEEFNKFADFNYTLNVLTGSGVQKTAELKKMYGGNLQVAVINYESMWRLEKELTAWGADLIISNLAVFEGGGAVIHTLSKTYPKYKYAETQDKIKHFLDSGTKPMNCTTIAEKGFKCPKLQDGSCKCKSPAAMSFQPLDADFLRELLNEQTIRSNAVDNIQSAQNFVQDYMYNVDSVIAAVFITTELREYFHIKPADAKPLAAMQKDLYKSYKTHADTRKNQSAEALPEWYELNDKGGVRFLPGILADNMAANVDAFYGTGKYYFYNDGVYRTNNDDELAALAKTREHMIPRHATMAAISDAEGQWRMLIRKPVNEINSNPFIINARNGLYNTLDGTMKEHTPEYHSTIQIAANYDPDAVCPQFLEFLRGILPESEIPLIQEIFGYVCVPIAAAKQQLIPLKHRRAHNFSFRTTYRHLRHIHITAVGKIYFCFSVLFHNFYTPFVFSVLHLQSFTQFTLHTAHQR